MTAAEAGAVQLEEPDWHTRFAQIAEDHKELFLLNCVWDAAFELVLFEYRHFHFTWLENGKRRPLEASKAVIALAKMGIMAPRSLVKDVPHSDTLEGYQYDDHCWLVNERAWRIVAIEDQTMCLDSFGETKQVDLAAAKWDKYVAQRLEILGGHPHEAPH